MRKTIIALAILALVGGGVALAASGTNDSVAQNPATAECSGKIECPLTGEMVSPDDCPLASGAMMSETADAAGDVPACCRGK